MPDPTPALALLALVVAGGLAGAADADLATAQARLEQSLIAPCCFHYTVAEHRSPASDAVREDIRQRLRATTSACPWSRRAPCRPDSRAGCLTDTAAPAPPKGPLAPPQTRGAGE